MSEREFVRRDDADVRPEALDRADEERTGHTSNSSPERRRTIDPDELERFAKEFMDTHPVIMAYLAR